MLGPPGPYRVTFHEGQGPGGGIDTCRCGHRAAAQEDQVSQGWRGSHCTERMERLGDGGTCRREGREISPWSHTAKTPRAPVRRNSWLGSKAETQKVTLIEG